MAQQRGRGAGLPGGRARHIGIVDIGSNSIRLVVFDGLSRIPHPLFNEKVLCGLGRGLERTGRLNPDGVALALDNLARFATVAGAMDVRELKVVTLEDAVRKMTSLPARILGLPARGQLREGFAADVVVFDPARVRDTATFEKPKSYAEGVPFVIVNGVIVIDNNQHTGARPGRALLGRRAKKLS